MKKIYYILTLLLCVYVQTANAQMGVNSNGAVPNAAAMLDVRSTDKGFLMPRLTTTQRNAMPAIADGLMIYNVTTAELEIYRSIAGWQTASRMGVPFTVAGTVNGGGISNGIIIANNSGTGPAVSGQTFGTGVGAGYFLGNTANGVYGVSTSANGVFGQSTSGNGGFFTSTTGTALGITGAGSTSSTSSTASPLIRIGITNDDNYGWIRYENSTGVRHFSQRYDLFSTAAASNSYALYYGGDQLFTIRGDGKFGLNVNTPLDLLHLKAISSTGDVFARISSTNGFTGLRLDNNTGDYQLFSNEFGGLFLDYSTDNYATRTGIITFAPNASNFEMRPAITNNVLLGTSSFRWREIWSQNALNTSSDRRLKKNINEIKYGLDEVMKLQAVTYNWKDNDDKKLQLGFIAQDVEKIVPEIVTKSGISDEEFERLEKKGEKVTDTYGMQYTGLIPVLVKAVQEQQKVIEDKANRISQLESKLQKMNDLEARLNLIEAVINSQKLEIHSSINDK